VILLDTNVISELIRPAPAQAVTAFLLQYEPAELFTAAVCEAELQYGIARLPSGRRRDDLATRIATFLSDSFDGQILPFDSICARHYASIRAGREIAGYPITVEDAMIAATARAYGAVLATRNGRDFVGCGITLIDPWQM
jgi:predicted nucleic acid-binding protein